MFDFSKLDMHTTHTTGYEAAAVTDTEIAEREKYCGHVLPENYKTILRNYNGRNPAAKYFETIDESTGVFGER